MEESINDEGNYNNEPNKKQSRDDPSSLLDKLMKE